MGYLDSPDLVTRVPKPSKQTEISVNKKAIWILARQPQFSNRHVHSREHLTKWPLPKPVINTWYHA